MLTHADGKVTVKRRTALIELLVVIAIIAILAAILFPSSPGRERTRKSAARET